MRFLFYLFILTSLLSCNLFDNESKVGGRVTLSLSREFQGDEVKLKLTHESGYSFEESFKSTITLDNLKMGTWEIHASVFNKDGVEIRKGLTYVYINDGDNLEVVIPLAPVGVGSIEINAQLLCERADWLYIAAYDTSDYSKEFVLFNDTPKSKEINLSSQEIPSGLYQIRTAIVRSNRIIGGNTFLALIENSSLTTKDIVIEADTELAINSNIIYRFFIESDPGLVFGQWRTVNYRVYDLDYSLGVDLRYSMSTSYPINIVDQGRDYNCSIKVEKTTAKIVEFDVENSNSLFQGKFTLTFGSENSGIFKFDDGLGGPILTEGSFTLFEDRREDIVCYQIIEKEFSLLDMPNLGSYDGVFNQILNPLTNKISFYSEPFRDLDTFSKSTTTSLVNNPDIQTFNRDIIWYKGVDDPNKSYTVSFNLNGVESYIQYFFYSEYKGLAQYQLPNGSGGLLYSIAPFTLSSYSDYPFMVYDGSHNRYRRTWSYTQSLDHLGTDYFNGTLISVASDKGPSTPIDFSFNRSPKYSSIEINISSSPVPLFDDVDYLGKLSTGEYLLKGLYVGDSANDSFLDLSTSQLLDNEPVIIVAEFGPAKFRVFKYGGDIKNTLIDTPPVYSIY